MHIIHQKMWFGPRMCLLGVETIKNFIWGVITQKPPHFGAGIGISSLNVRSNNFRMAQPILITYSSNDAAPERNLVLKVKKLKFAFWGVIDKKLPQTEFPSQNTPFHNFLTTQPIHTNSNSIDAAQQAEYDAKFKKIKILIQGSTFHQNSPKGNFPAKNQNVFITFERTKIGEHCQWTT